MSLKEELDRLIEYQAWQSTKYYWVYLLVMLEKLKISDPNMNVDYVELKSFCRRFGPHGN